MAGSHIICTTFSGWLLPWGETENNSGIITLYKLYHNVNGMENR